MSSKDKDKSDYGKKNTSKIGDQVKIIIIIFKEIKRNVLLNYQ